MKTALLPHGRLLMSHVPSLCISITLGIEQVRNKTTVVLCLKWRWQSATGLKSLPKMKQLLSQTEFTEHRFSVMEREGSAACWSRSATNSHVKKLTCNEQHIFTSGCPRWEISCWAVKPSVKEVLFSGIVGLNWQFQPWLWSALWSACGQLLTVIEEDARARLETGAKDLTGAKCLSWEWNKVNGII